MDDRKRQERIARDRTGEVQKIEIISRDVDGIEIDVKILNKLKRKIHRRG